MTMLHYGVGIHDVVSMEKALVECGTNGGICHNDVTMLQGCEWFVDDSVLA
jgi:hypothetical protein